MIKGHLTAVLSSDPTKSKVEFNGQPVPGVTQIVAQLHAGVGIPQVRVDLVAWNNEVMVEGDGELWVEGPHVFSTEDRQRLVDLQRAFRAHGEQFRCGPDEMAWLLDTLARLTSRAV